MKEKLIQLLQNIKNHSELSSMLYSKNIDIANWECPYMIGFDLFCELYFTKNGIDIIDWWLYEVDEDNHTLYSDDKSEVDLFAVNDLVDYVLKNYKI